MAGEVTFTPSEGDFIGAQRDAVRRFLRTPRVRLGAVGFIGILLLLSLVETALGVGASPLWSAVGYLGFGLLVLMLTRISLFVGLAPRARRLYRQQKILHQEFTYCWSDDGIVSSAETGITTVPWSRFHGWYEGPTAFIVYSNEQTFHFLPRRHLSEADAEDLRTTLQRHGPARL